VPLMVALDSIDWIGRRPAKTYYRSYCVPASTIPLADRVYFRTEQAAKDSGFSRAKDDLDCQRKPKP
jgi:hypothetical protein